MCYSTEINSALRVARKKHRCDWCGEAIEPKAKYWKWFGIVEGDAVGSKMHPECEKVSSEHADLVSPDCLYLDGTQPRGAFSEDR